MSASENVASSQRPPSVSECSPSVSECAITFKSLVGSRMFVLKCGHSFSEEIIDQVGRGTIQRCPICQAPIKEKPLRNWDLEAALREIAQQKGRIAKLKSDKRSLKERLAEAETVIGDLKLFLVESKAEARKREEKFYSTIADLEASNAESKATNAKLNLSIADLTTSKVALEAKVDALSSRSAPVSEESKKEIAELKEGISALESKNKQREEQIISLQATNAAFQKKMDSLINQRNSETVCDKLQQVYDHVFFGGLDELDRFVMGVLK